MTRTRTKSVLYATGYFNSPPLGTPRTFYCVRVVFSTPEEVRKFVQKMKARAEDEAVSFDFPTKPDAEEAQANLDVDEVTT